MNYLEEQTEVNQGLLALLKNNVIGTPGKSMLYKHTEIGEKLEHIGKYSFLTLSLRSTLLGVCCLCPREITADSTLIKASYLRYFTFHSGFRTDRRASRGLVNVNSKSNGIKKEIHHYFKKQLEESDLKTFYAYVDPKNERSAQLCNEFGFKEVRRFSSHLFSRLFPSKVVDFQKAKEAELAHIKLLLDSFYSGYNFYHHRNTFYRSNYYVIKNQEGQIIAGLHAHKEKWQILDMPGFSGSIITKVISRLPILNRLFKEDFDFLAIEGIYFKEGHVKLIEELLESLLAEFKLNKAIMFTDTNSILSAELKRLNMGSLEKFSTQTSIAVIAKVGNEDNSLQKQLINRPAYISTFDLI